MAGFAQRPAGAARAVLVLLLACVLPACVGDSERSPLMEAKAESGPGGVSIPPIDAAAPEEVVPATFAFG